MKTKVKKEIQKLIKKLELNCTVEKFKYRVNWNYISRYQKLSEDFIREFQTEVNWYYISKYRKLSEDFIREFQDKVDWYYISKYQKLSEDFIREFQDKVKWDYILCSQKLSKKFQKEFKDTLDLEIQNKTFKSKTKKQKLKEIKRYAKKYNLEFDGENLLAYRDHDINGCGLFNKTVYYEKGKYYKDWRCDMNKDCENSFGLGIWPEGNTKVKINVKDWGVSVNREDGKARVFGFEVV